VESIDVNLHEAGHGSVKRLRTTQNFTPLIRISALSSGAVGGRLSEEGGGGSDAENSCLRNCWAASTKPDQLCAARKGLRASCNAFFQRSDDSRMHQSLAVGVCAFDRRKRQDAAKPGAGQTTPDGTGSRVVEHYRARSGAGCESDSSGVGRRDETAWSRPKRLRLICFRY
jgi:hypothetical protein